jgi:hypothetical protein
MEKIFNQKGFNHFVWAPLGRRFNIKTIFFLQLHFKVSSLILFPLLTPVANLPQVSLIPVAICQIATGIVDTSGKFATGIADTDGKFA